MKCRNCGAEIADKALICYRCGTATTEAKYQPARIRPRRGSYRALITALIFLIVVLMIALLAAVLFYHFRVR